jgi:hypothetical protein
MVYGTFINSDSDIKIGRQGELEDCFLSLTDKYYIYPVDGICIV